MDSNLRDQHACSIPHTLIDWHVLRGALPHATAGASGRRSGFGYPGSLRRPDVTATCREHVLRCTAGVRPPIFDTRRAPLHLGREQGLSRAVFMLPLTLLVRYPCGMPRADRLSLTAGGLAMPPVDHLSNKETLNLLLDRSLSGVPPRLARNRTIIGLFTNFCRLTDKALREYDAARAELQTYVFPAGWPSARESLPSCHRPYGELHQRRPPCGAERAGAANKQNRPALPRA